MAIKLDEIDILLLSALEADADRTNVELARLTGLSPAATLHRVRSLKESGVIRIIRAYVDPGLAGFPLQVWVTAAMGRHDARSSAAFEEHVRKLPQIIAADSIAGETDYLLNIVARDVAELQRVLASLSARGGQRLVTYLRLAEVKPPSPLPLGVAPVPGPVRPSRRGGRRPLTGGAG
ncbi:MAG TPA: Lrp/AsnC family transcriptional regulator [Trebonia sp.]|nr:Lrp/AsnC family transcriptional regulator [Trebonia sp.]